MQAVEQASRERLTGLPPAPFIVGVGRSGTTMLRLMLDAHPDLAIPAETHFIPTMIGVEQSSQNKSRAYFLRTLTEFATWPNLALAADDIEKVLAETDDFSVQEGLRTIYRLYARRFGKQRWGDKTPPYRGCMLDIERLLPEAHFIHIIRDGRDTALSYRGLWFGPGDDVEAAARFWVEQITKARDHSRTLMHYLELRYEDLLMNPVRLLHDVTNYLELPFDPAMLDYHAMAHQRLGEVTRSPSPRALGEISAERRLAMLSLMGKPPDRGRIGRWRTEMSDADQRLFEAIAGPLLRELGYETRW